MFPFGGGTPEKLERGKPEKRKKNEKKKHKRKIKCIRLGEEWERCHGVIMEEKEKRKKKRSTNLTHLWESERV